MRRPARSTGTTAWAACGAVAGLAALVGCGGGGGGGGASQSLPAATVEMSIAAGETTTSSVLLWARVTVPGLVDFEISTTSTFASVATSSTQVVSDVTIPAKASFTGLASATPHFYRVTDALGAQLTGTFKTYDTSTSTLRFGVTGDWRGELAPYPGVRNVPDRNLDFFVTLGDSIYADSASPFLNKPAPDEQFSGVGASTLEEYRLKHSEVYSRRFGLNTLADVRAATTWYATIDDHEVFDNHAGGAPFDGGDDPDERFAFIAPTTTIRYNNQTPIFQNALQAFTEYHPIQDTAYASTTNPFAQIAPDPRLETQRKLYRTWQAGESAFFLTDSRSFRSEPVAPVANFATSSVLAFFGAAAATTDSHTPAEPRTLLGAQQTVDLINDLIAAEDAGATWKFVFTSVPMANAGPVANGEDRWDGYLFERTLLLARIAGLDITTSTSTGVGLFGGAGATPINNVVFVCADIHGTVVNNLTFNDPSTQALVAVPGCWEISTGSVGFSPPLAVSLVEIAAGAGLLPADQKAIYDSLPQLAQRDAFAKQLLNTVADNFGFDRLGLDSVFLPGGSTATSTTSTLATGIGFDPAPASEGGDVLAGDHALAVHYFGWTEFSIEEVDGSSVLTVTTFGIDFYTDAELVADPSGIAAREPRILSQFRVTAIE